MDSESFLSHPQGGWIMKKRGLIAAVVLVYSLALMQGCSSDDSSAALVNNIPADDSQNTGGGGGGGTIVVGDLGELTDLGDGLFPAGDHWYSTRARAINGQGIVIGETNWGSTTTSGAFKWDPALQAGLPMTFLGIHGGFYDDYYNQRITNPIQNPKPFAFSEAIDISGSGSIIGNSLTGDGGKRAFIWDNGFVDLPPISGILFNGAFTDASINSFSEAVDINEKGEVVLTLDDNTEAGRHAYYWDGISTTTVDLPRDDNTPEIVGTFISVIVPDYEPLGTIVGTTSEAVAINENGQVLMNSGGTALFFDRNWDVLEELNHLPGANLTFAVDLNDSIYTNNDGIPDGHAIGNSGNFVKAELDEFLNNSYLEADAGMTVANLGEVQGFFWDGGAMYPVNHLGGGKSVAADLNNKDQVVGGALTAEGATHAILWTLGSDKKGIIRDLGTLGGVNSMALAINEAGQVVGWSETGALYQEQGVVMPIRHGFLWDNGRMYDLGTHDNFYDYPFKPPYPFSEAVDINESGALTGNSITINDHSRGFYLQPVIPAP
jgi:probable HAF family extracellular repeat protein